MVSAANCSESLQRGSARMGDSPRKVLNSVHVIDSAITAAVVEAICAAVHEYLHSCVHSVVVLH